MSTPGLRAGALPNAAASREWSPRPRHIQQEWRVLDQGQVVEDQQRPVPIVLRHGDPPTVWMIHAAMTAADSPRTTPTSIANAARRREKLVDPNPRLSIEIEHGPALTADHGLR